MPRKEKSPQSYYGTTDLGDYLQHFTRIAGRNGWDYDDAGEELATSLEGPARQILATLPAHLANDYITIVGALALRFDPEGREFHYSAQLMESTWREEDEDLSTYGHNLARMAQKAYPGETLPERVTIDMFIRGLPDAHMKTHVATSKPKSLAEAINAATAYDTFNPQRKSSKKKKPDAMVAPVMRTKPTQTQGESDNTQNHQGSTDNRPRTACHICHRLGHFAKECWFRPGGPGPPPRETQTNKQEN